MVIRIKKYCHYNDDVIVYIGEVLEWTQTVEKFGSEYMQIPAVIIKRGAIIDVISLKEPCYWCEIEHLGGENDN